MGYHVKLNNGVIEAGVMSKNGKWNGSDVTQEALAAVRDHILTLIQQENKDIGIIWHYNNGKSIVMKLEEKDTSEIQEEENEGVPQD